MALLKGKTYQEEEISKRSCWQTSCNYCTEKLYDKNNEVFANGHCEWWRCGFSMRSMDVFIATCHPKRFRVYMGKLAPSMEVFWPIPFVAICFLVNFHHLTPFFPFVLIVVAIF